MEYELCELVQVSQFVIMCPSCTHINVKKTLFDALSQSECETNKKVLGKSLVYRLFSVWSNCSKALTQIAFAVPEREGSFRHFVKTCV